MPLTNMIPVSEINKMIEKVLASETKYHDFEVVNILTDLSKKAISAVSIEKIDEQILICQDVQKIPNLSYERQYIIASVLIPILEDLKK